GNKRNEISEEQIDRIVEMYGQTTESDNVKIFNNEDFGYYRVTVERPLRLNFQITEERIEKLGEERAFKNLATSRKRGEEKEKEIEAGKQQQETIKTMLKEIQSETVYKNRVEFIDVIKAAFKDTDVNLRAPLLKAIWNALPKRDETANVCMKNKKDIEPDTELTANEVITQAENIEKYFERQLLPHLSDTWIDEEQTRTGYDLPFTRNFYQY